MGPAAGEQPGPPDSGNGEAAGPPLTGRPSGGKPNRGPRRNDSRWRADVLAAYGARCVSCGDTRHVQADHLWPRAQGGPSDVLNGLPLCGEYSAVTRGGCHPAKTAGRLLIDPAWLTAAQREFLADGGWVAWDRAGAPYGRGFRHFTGTTHQSGALK